MRLAVRLFLAFGLLGAATPLALGYQLREARRVDDVARFHKDLSSACDAIAGELGRGAARDVRLMQSACTSPDLAIKLTSAMSRGAPKGPCAGPLATWTQTQRMAFDLDELVVAEMTGRPLAIDPHGPCPASAEAQQAGRPNTTAFGAGTDVPRAGLSYLAASGGPPTEVVACAVPARLGHDEDARMLVGVRYLDAPAARLAKGFGVGVAFETVATADPPGTVRAVCALPLGSTTVTLAVTRSETGLLQALARGDRTVYTASGLAAAAAVLLALLFSRSLGRPLAQLAFQATQVAEEKAVPLQVRGSGEIAELAQAFDRMLGDLSATRRKLAAASRVAAWREVARRVAHEIKNPLMPIRAAVETLRRLRARNDPRFDDYFDEASRTVLDEVQRIATIVSEFTRFARLPPPRPTVTDPKEVAAYVASLHDGKDNIPVVVLADADVPTVMADRDQIVQVLINLVQNAQDAVRSANEADLVHQTPESEGVSSEPHVPAGAPARSVGAKAPGTAERTEPVGASPRQVTIRLRARESLEGARASGRAKVSTLLASRRRDDRPAPRLTDGVIIEVEDDGNGVPAEFVEHLFEPYATTKSHGTGLGLAIAARIAVEHGGDLSYEARNPGARFRLFLSEIGSFAPASTRGDG